MRRVSQTAKRLSGSVKHGKRVDRMLVPDRARMTSSADPCAACDGTAPCSSSGIHGSGACTAGAQDNSLLDRSDWLSSSAFRLSHRRPPGQRLHGRSAHGPSCRPGCSTSFRNEMVNTRGRRPAVRGAEPWRAARVERWPVGPRGEWRPAVRMAAPWRGARRATSRLVPVIGRRCRPGGGTGRRPIGGDPARRWPRARPSAS